MNETRGGMEEKDALELGALLAEHKGGDTLVMDMRPLGFWTDFFVITTVTSGAHFSGLEKHIKEFAWERNAFPKGSKKSASGDGWHLVDLGNVVIHLMSAGSRAFYELERLWQDAPVIYRALSAPPGVNYANERE